MSMKQQTIQPASWADVAAALIEMPISEATRRDYKAALNRGSNLMGRNRLEDIPADLVAFEKKFGYDDFDPILFASEAAYRAWRRKVIAALKHFVGNMEAERALRGVRDDWTVFLARAEEFIETRDGWSDADLIALKNLAREARRKGWMPGMVTTEQLGLLPVSWTLG